MEEIYHFRIKPQGGFGIQRIYDGKELDELYVINDGDTVMLPKGYHPVVAAPGYSLYYLWILSGETRFMAPYEDPAHVWQRGAEAVINEILR
jgi:5-deoxy-glucuronate isomerase